MHLEESINLVENLETRRTAQLALAHAPGPKLRRTSAPSARRSRFPRQRRSGPPNHRECARSSSWFDPTPAEPAAASQSNPPHCTLLRGLQPTIARPGGAVGPRPHLTAHFAADIEYQLL
jgi:hypothetical protein